jgi:hypothetical protein
LRRRHRRTLLCRDEAAQPEPERPSPHCSIHLPSQPGDDALAGTASTITRHAGCVPPRGVHLRAQCCLCARGGGVRRERERGKRERERQRERKKANHTPRVVCTAPCSEPRSHGLRAHLPCAPRPGVEGHLGRRPRSQDACCRGRWSNTDAIGGRRFAANGVCCTNAQHRMIEPTCQRPRHRDGLPRAAKICGGRLPRCRATAILPPSVILAKMRLRALFGVSSPHGRPGA